MLQSSKSFFSVFIPFLKHWFPWFFTALYGLSPCTPPCHWSLFLLKQSLSPHAFHFLLFCSLFNSPHYFDTVPLLPSETCRAPSLPCPAHPPTHSPMKFSHSNRASFLWILHNCLFRGSYIEKKMR